MCKRRALELEQAMAESSGERAQHLHRANNGENSKSSENGRNEGDVPIYIFQQVELRLNSLKPPGSIGGEDAFGVNGLHHLYTHPPLGIQFGQNDKIEVFPQGSRMCLMVSVVVPVAYISSAARSLHSAVQQSSRPIAFLGWDGS